MLMNFLKFRNNFCCSGDLDYLIDVCLVGECWCHYCLTRETLLHCCPFQAVAVVHQPGSAIDPGGTTSPGRP